MAYLIGNKLEFNLIIEDLDLSWDELSQRLLSTKYQASKLDNRRINIDSGKFIYMLIYTHDIGRSFARLQIVQHQPAQKKHLVTRLNFGLRGQKKY